MFCFCFFIPDWSFISNNHSKHSRYGLLNFRSREHAPILCCSTLREQWSTSYMQQPGPKSCGLCLQPLTTNWVRSGKYLNLFLVQKHQKAGILFLWYLSMLNKFIFPQRGVKTCHNCTSCTTNNHVRFDMKCKLIPDI